MGWTFSVSDGALDNLQAGQTLTQTYAVQVSDGHGGTATQNVVITLTGTNDAPVITSAAQTGAVTELADNAAGENTATLSTTGAVSFSDVDTLDIHSATVTPVGSGYLGTLTLAAVN